MSTYRLKQEEFTKDMLEFIKHCFDSGYTVTMGEVYRTADQQKIYYDTGRSKTMNSMHLKRSAMDLNIFKDGRLLVDKTELQDLGDSWEAMSSGNRWGGNWTSFKDLPHFEKFWI
jgi:peptidoglycan L-alanyl-D-glutamate endopeptidase CwlK